MASRRGLAVPVACYNLQLTYLHTCTTYIPNIHVHTPYNTKPVYPGRAGLAMRPNGGFVQFGRQQETVMTAFPASDGLNQCNTRRKKTLVPSYVLLPVPKVSCHPSHLEIVNLHCIGAELHLYQPSWQVALVSCPLPSLRRAGRVVTGRIILNLMPWTHVRRRTLAHAVMFKRSLVRSANTRYFHSTSHASILSPAPPSLKPALPSSTSSFRSAPQS